jgi:hypothetical protein
MISDKSPGEEEYLMEIIFHCYNIKPLLYFPANHFNTFFYIRRLDIFEMNEL